MMYLDPTRLDVHDDPMLALAAAILWRAVLDVQEFGASDAREFLNTRWFGIIAGALDLDCDDVRRRVAALGCRAVRAIPRYERA